MNELHKSEIITTAERRISAMTRKYVNNFRDF
jgi:hypothetical protein